MTWIQTFSGKKFSLIDPQPEDVDIGDIVAALCKLVRFTGHCRGMYTVAQHSVHVADLVPSELCYAALLHDAPEAYYGDFSRPLKQAANLISRGHFSQMLHRIDVVVFDALGIADFDDRGPRPDGRPARALGSAASSTGRNDLRLGTPTGSQRVR